MIPSHDDHEAVQAGHLTLRCINQLPELRCPPERPQPAGLTLSVKPTLADTAPGLDCTISSVGRLTKSYRLQVSSVGDDRSCLDLDAGRGGRQRRDLNKDAGGANLPKHFQMDLGDERSVGRVHDIHDRAHNVA